MQTAFQVFRSKPEVFLNTALQGEIEDAGAGILTSVGQNTPPPSPKESSGSGKDEAREPPCLSVRVILT